MLTHLKNIIGVTLHTIIEGRRKTKPLGQPVSEIYEAFIACAMNDILHFSLQTLVLL